MWALRPLRQLSTKPVTVCTPYDAMKRSKVPLTIYNINMALKQCAYSRDSGSAIQILSEMDLCGLKPNEFTIEGAIKVCAISGIDFAALKDKVLSMRLVPRLIPFTDTLVRTIRAQDYDRASELIELGVTLGVKADRFLVENNMFVYRTLQRHGQVLSLMRSWRGEKSEMMYYSAIATLVETEQYSDALVMIDELLEDGIECTRPLFLQSIMKACVESKNDIKGIELFTKFQKAKPYMNKTLETVARMAIRSGDLELGVAILRARLADPMVFTNPFLVTDVLTAFSEKGEWKTCRDLYLEFGDTRKVACRQFIVASLHLGEIAKISEYLTKIGDNNVMSFNRYVSSFPEVFESWMSLVESMGKQTPILYNSGLKAFISRREFNKFDTLLVKMTSLRMKSDSTFFICVECFILRKEYNLVFDVLDSFKSVCGTSGPQRLYDYAITLSTDAKDVKLTELLLKRIKVEGLSIPNLW